MGNFLAPMMSVMDTPGATFSTSVTSVAGREGVLRQSQLPLRNREILTLLNVCLSALGTVKTRLSLPALCKLCC